MPTPMNINQYADGLIMLCTLHRKRYGIKAPLRVNDCELIPCRTGCPIKNMPRAVSQEELDEIEMEVFMEAVREKRKEKLEMEG